MPRYISPGVYVEELPAGSRTISGAATSITAFIGRTLRGPENIPVKIQSFSEYEHEFGGLWQGSPVSYAVQHYFNNGGRDALIVRVQNGRDEITDNHISHASLQSDNLGLWALEQADTFNILCIPPLTMTPGADVNSQTRNAAAAYCERRRAVYIIDPLNRWSKASHLSAADGLESADWGLSRNPNTALYFPRIILPDPSQRNRLSEFAPCGAVAGVIARTDIQRGIWKAAAGKAAALKGVTQLTADLTNAENDALNRLGINCLRTFSGPDPVVWGVRTLMGADHLGSEWKYLPVRRLALHIEESLIRGIQWAAFEPNAEPLWTQIRLNLGAFLNDLFRQGALQGEKPSDAYYVRCDSQTTTQNDIDQGVFNIEIGFAPLKPVEFVVLKIQQIAGQT